MTTQTMTIPQFLNGSHREESQAINKLIAHLKRHKITYRIVGTSIFIFLMATDVAFAASTGIDVGGRKIYSKLLNLSKWVIIIRGGWSSISNAISGDFDTAKKSFFQYLMVYLIMLALPWALDEIDIAFKDI